MQHNGFLQGQPSLFLPHASIIGMWKCLQFVAKAGRLAQNVGCTVQFLEQLAKKQGQNNKTWEVVSLCFWFFFVAFLVSKYFYLAGSDSMLAIFRVKIVSCGLQHSLARQGKGKKIISRDLSSCYLEIKKQIEAFFSFVIILKRAITCLDLDTRKPPFLLHLALHPTNPERKH